MNLQGGITIPHIEGFSFVNDAINGPAMHALLVTKDASLSRDVVIRTNICELLGFAVSKKELWTIDNKNFFLEAVAEQGVVSRNTAAFLLRIVINARRRFVNHHKRLGTPYSTSSATRAADELGNHESTLSKAAMISGASKFDPKRRQEPDEQPVKRPRLAQADNSNINPNMGGESDDLPEDVLENELAETNVPQDFFQKGKRIFKPLLDPLIINEFTLYDASQAWGNGKCLNDYVVERISDFLGEIGGLHQEDKRFDTNELSGIQQRLCDTLKRTLSFYSRTSQDPLVAAIKISGQVRETVLQVTGIMENILNAERRGDGTLNQVTQDSERRLAEVAKEWDMLDTPGPVIDTED